MLHPQIPGIPSGGTEENRPSSQRPNYLFAFSCTAHESPFTQSGKDDGAEKRSLFPLICFRKAGALSAKWLSIGLVSYYRKSQLPWLSCQSPGIRQNISTIVFFFQQSCEKEIEVKRNSIRRHPNSLPHHKAADAKLLQRHLFQVAKCALESHRTEFHSWLDGYLCNLPDTRSFTKSHPVVWKWKWCLIFPTVGIHETMNENPERNLAVSGT